MRADEARDCFSPDLAPGERAVFFQGDASLEGKFGWPDRPPEGARPIAGGVVIAHPYPPGGANMDLPVVHHIAKACRQRGLAGLRFNFRGVGASEGTFDGREEDRDVLAALSFMRAQLDAQGTTNGDSLPLGLAGWSFGSVMAARAASESPKVRALALVGFPLHWEALPADTLERLGGYDGPVLAVCAENDHHGTPEEVEKALSALGVDLRVEVIHGADHYLQGRQREVAELVGDFFAREIGRA